MPLHMAFPWESAVKPQQATHLEGVSHFPRAEAEGMLPFLPATFGVITIRSAGEAPYSVPEGTLALELVFDDHDMAGAPDFIKEVYEERACVFSDQQANQVLDWLAAHEGVLSGVMVFCLAGQSRSAAVARFIADVYGLAFDPIRGKHYNHWVYARLLTALEQRRPWKARLIRAWRSVTGHFSRMEA